MKKFQTGLLLLMSLSFAPLVLADPPPWAPAHGWRKKNDPNYVGYTGKQWDQDYGVLEGSCDAAKIGTVLGGVAGGVIGGQVAKDSPNRPVAILVGTVLGAVIGNKIGAEVGSGDQGCVGHALELAGEKSAVKWTNAQTGVSYVLTPTRNMGDQANPCRAFTTVASAGGDTTGSKGNGKGKGNAKGKGHGAHGKTTIDAVACRKPTGEWEITQQKAI